MSTMGNFFDLPPFQEAIWSALKDAAMAWERAQLPWSPYGYVMGKLRMPALIRDGAEVFPARDHTVFYNPDYGVTCDLCTSNGSARMIARCVPDGTVWEPTEVPNSDPSKALPR